MQYESFGTQGVGDYHDLATDVQSLLGVAGDSDAVHDANESIPAENRFPDRDSCKPTETSNSH